MPRSDTSLVEQILASHPEVFGAGELKDLATVYRSLDNFTDSLQGDSFPEALVGLDADEYANLGRQYIAKIRQYSSPAS